MSKMEKGDTHSERERVVVYAVEVGCKGCRRARMRKERDEHGTEESGKEKVGDQRSRQRVVAGSLAVWIAGKSVGGSLALRCDGPGFE